MKKRTMLLGCTLLVSLIYAGGFILLFSQDEPQSVLLVSEEHETEDCLYWLQAGVFKEESSYQDLKQELAAYGAEVVCASSDDLTYVLVSPTTQKEKLDELMGELTSAGIEVISKQAELDESQKQLLFDNRMEDLMKELVHQ